MIGRLKCVRNGVKIFGRLSARNGRVWSAVFKKCGREGVKWWSTVFFKKCFGNGCNKSNA